MSDAGYDIDRARHSVNIIVIEYQGLCVRECPSIPQASRRDLQFSNDDPGQDKEDMTHAMMVQRIRELSV